MTIEAALASVHHQLGLIIILHGDTEDDDLPIPDPIRGSPLYHTVQRFEQYLHMAKMPVAGWLPWVRMLKRADSHRVSGDFKRWREFYDEAIAMRSVIAGQQSKLTWKRREFRVVVTSAGSSIEFTCHSREPGCVYRDGDGFVHACPIHNGDHQANSRSEMRLIAKQLLN